CSRSCDAGRARERGHSQGTTWMGGEEERERKGKRGKEGEKRKRKGKREGGEGRRRRGEKEKKKEKGKRKKRGGRGAGKESVKYINITNENIADFAKAALGELNK
ncbi:hypothetical protein, partial [Anoxybacillus flavithermus]|uniref:hypothetical protein n=1 Tax=Anoxybacillus flavithermus TaxID=33934 RepID=UPI0019D51B05